ncbi:MAG: MBL fold metallo-hydrolase [Lachnospiraceae bacterium]|nr:MBL fold metallo-hydrolase [Lachnospiraceae bacterium]
MGNIKIGRIVLGVYGTNCYFLYREGENKVIIVDAPDYGDSICANMEKNGFQVAGVLLTHGHFDHIWGAGKLRTAASESAEKRGEQPVRVYAAEEERELLMDTNMNVSAAMKRPCSFKADVYVRDGDVITIAGMTFRVLLTPGHTSGSCCYYFEEAGFLLCGDTIFLESVGRTDFPTGSMSALVRSVKEKLFILPDDTKLYPGHGEATTVGHEKKYNPFLV